MMNGTKKDQEKSQSQLKETIAGRVKLRRRRGKVDDDDLSDMSPLEVDEEDVKGRTGLKILTPNKSSTRLPILLAQIKFGINSSELKNEIRQIPYLLYQHNKITKKVTAI